MSSLPRVLVVDDEERFRTTTCRLLRMRGLEAVASESGPDALQKLKEETYDVVLLDVKMPEMSGLDALIEMRRLEPDLQVIILTGYASVDTAVEIMQRGGYDYLLKPCPIDELMEKIDRAYERKIDRDKRLRRNASNDRRD